MKINRKSIKDLYAAHVVNRTRPLRDFCPQPEEIVDSLRGRLPQKEKEKLVEHLSRCSLCLEEFRFFLETKREEKWLIQSIINQKGRFRLFNRQLKKTPGLFFLKTWKPVPVAAAVFLILVLISTIYVSHRNRQKYRGEKTDILKLIQPIHKKQASLPLIFRWKEAKGAEYYVFELFDEALLPVWRSRPVFSQVYTLPADVAGKLTTGMAYFWYVTAFFPSDKKIESPLEQFRVK